VDDDDEVVEAQANETTDSSVMAWDEDSEVSQAEGSYIDVSQLFELNLTETPEYAAAYDTYTTPLDMDDMADELKVKKSLLPPRLLLSDPPSQGLLRLPLCPSFAFLRSWQTSARPTSRAQRSATAACGPSRGWRSRIITST